MPDRKTILVVEDEGVVARQLQLSLLDLGYQVPATASSAEEAFLLADEQRPDLVLMDIHLEGPLDGIEAAAILRERLDVPIVYLTAFADAATVERAKVTEPYAYLVKPVDASKLAAAVEVALYKHQLDHQLRLSEAKFSGIVSISADAIITVDEEQRITLFNEGAEEIFGYSKSEVMGQPLDVLLPTRLRERHREHVKSFAGGPMTACRMGERDLVLYGRRKNGDEFAADGSISKLTVGDRRLFTVVLRDISEQKRIENEQRFLSELGAVLSSSLDYQETLTSIEQLVVRDLADWCLLDLVEEGGLTPRTKVTSADPAKAPIAELLETLCPQRCGIVSRVLETKRPLLIQEMTGNLLESLAQSEESLVVLRAAEIRSVVAVPLTLRGELLGVMGLASSRPSRRYGPNDLRLAEEVAHRAALAIENARLYLRAKGAVEARDGVLGVVAHDLRSPLTAIMMVLARLRRNAMDAERHTHAVDVIDRASTRMNRLIQDLLDVTRMEAGRLSIDRSSVSSSQLVVDAVEAQSDAASSASLDLQLESVLDLPEIWADRDRVLQVFENLIGNAIKFSKPGGRITVAAEHADGEVLFSVADTGSGIDAENLPHLFDRFWQARSASKRTGAGLGLAIVKGIVDSHGGRIWVESKVDQGTAFYFTIPTAKVAATV